MEALDAEGRIQWSSSVRPYLRRYLHEHKGTPIKSVITDIPSLLKDARQRGYIEVKRYANDWQIAHFLGIETQQTSFSKQEYEEDNFKWLDEMVKRQMEAYQRYMEGE